jgi:hypothetical protein
MGQWVSHQTFPDAFESSRLHEAKEVEAKQGTEGCLIGAALAGVLASEISSPMVNLTSGLRPLPFWVFHFHVGHLHLLVPLTSLPF